MEQQNPTNQNSDQILLIGRSKECRTVCVVVENQAGNEELITRAKKHGITIEEVNVHYFKKLMTEGDIIKPDLSLMRKLELVPLETNVKKPVVLNPVNRRQRRMKDRKRRR